MLLRILLSITLGLICTIDLNGQSYQGLEAVKLFNVIDGDSIALDYKSSGPLAVIVFTSNFCPYSVKYEDRIKELYQRFSKRDIQFLLVNPNDTPEDSIEEMKRKARTQNYPFPYLKDHQQVLTEIMGATRTPEVFLIRPVKNGFELVYRGAIDDNPQTAHDVESPYLRNAIQSVLAGDSLEYTEVRVTGCIIKGE
jgi:thiol-disulfide isomerase/thioredoxin